MVAPKTVIRDQVGDHLLTPKNAAMVVLDYQPSWVALAVELQRDWARLETVQEVVQIVLTERLLKEA